MRRIDLVKHVPQGSESVLDIGSCEAEIHQDLRDKGVKRYVGVDLIDNPKHNALMKQRLDEYHVIDLNKNIFPFKPKEFDVIICGDVLEHLVDPWNVLKRLKEYLKDDGIMIVSLPNSLNHYKVLRRILSGTTQYEGAGLWDHTHVRFFTKQSMVGLFDWAGLKITKTDPNYEYDPWIYEKRHIIKAHINELLRMMCFGSTDKSELEAEDPENYFIIQFRFILKKVIEATPGK